MIRLATFNLENLFTRPAAMNGKTDEFGRQAIEDHAELNTIVSKEEYSEADRKRLLALTKVYKFHVPNPPKNALVKLQKIRGALFRRAKDGTTSVVAEGRSSWTGWFELRRGDVAWTATLNTGKVIDARKPDILVVVEVEDRPTLDRFNDQVLAAEFKWSYPHFMVIDGNDDRGIDVGILSRFPIGEIRSHVDDLYTAEEKIFSRDCVEFDILLGDGQRIVVLANHFKSKRNGDDADSQAKRRRQAERAHEIAVAALERSRLVVVAGDLNDTPESDPLAQLFTGGFEDVMTHKNYPKDRPGTYATGLASGKFDYLIMSPEMRGKLKDTGIERRGSYHPKLWKAFETVTPENEASDHHMVWAELDL